MSVYILQQKFNYVVAVIQRQPVLRTEEQSTSSSSTQGPQELLSLFPLLVKELLNQKIDFNKVRLASYEDRSNEKYDIHINFLSMDTINLHLFDMTVNDDGDTVTDGLGDQFNAILIYDDGDDDDTLKSSSKSQSIRKSQLDIDASISTTVDKKRRVCKILSSYDQVIVSSSRSYDSYVRSFMRYYDFIKSNHYMFPSMTIYEMVVSSKWKRSFLDTYYTLIWRQLHTKKYKSRIQSRYEFYRTITYKENLLTNSSNNNNSKYFALIVEPGINPYFEISVRTLFYHLLKRSRFTWHIVIMHSHSNEDFIRSSLFDIKESISFKLLSHDNKMYHVNNYNELMKRASFWKPYKDPGTKVLVFQSDSIILLNSTSIDKFLPYHYVGAPWHNVWNERLQTDRTKYKGRFLDGVGNGGFSLRSGDVMFEIASKFQSTHDEQEDMYFVRHIEDLHLNFGVASRFVAWKFAYEVKCEDIIGKQSDAKGSLMESKFSDIPLGLHAAWYYWDESEISKYLAFI